MKYLKSSLKQSLSTRKLGQLIVLQKMATNSSLGLINNLSEKIKDVKIQIKKEGEEMSHLRFEKAESAKDKLAMIKSKTLNKLAVAKFLKSAKRSQISEISERAQSSVDAKPQYTDQGTDSKSSTTFKTFFSPPKSKDLTPFGTRSVSSIQSPLKNTFLRKIPPKDTDKDTYYASVQHNYISNLKNTTSNIFQPQPRMANIPSQASIQSCYQTKYNFGKMFKTAREVILIS
jgi:hypothetical protein